MKGELVAIVKASKAKKYNGIYKYYRDSDKQKITRGYYLKYRDEFNKSPMTKLNSKTLEDALIEADLIRTEVKKKKLSFKQDDERLQRAKDSKKLTLNQLAELYDEDNDSKNASKEIQAYRNRIAEHLGDKFIAKITTEDIKNLPRKYVKNKLKIDEVPKKIARWELKDKETRGEKPSSKVPEPIIAEYSPKTMNNSTDLLSAMFNYAVYKKYIETSPISRNTKHKDEHISKEPVSTETGRILSDDDLELLFDTLLYGTDTIRPNKRLYTLCKLLYFTGARPDAIINLKVSDYNPNDHTIYIKAMKKAKGYSQHLTTKAEVLITERIAEHNLSFDDALFYAEQTFNRTGKGKDTPARYEALRATARPIFDALFNEGIPTQALLRRVGFYSLRRTSATKIYKAKGLAHASKFLHHSDVRTTMKYLGIDEDTKEAIEEVL